MRNLILSSLNTARSRAVRLLAHIFNPFSSIKNLQLKKGVFLFLLPIRTYTYIEPSQMNIFKYFCILD